MWARFGRVVVVVVMGAKYHPKKKASVYNPRNCEDLCVESL
jgi:hypothetical protein